MPLRGQQPASTSSSGVSGQPCPAAAAASNGAGGPVDARSDAEAAAAAGTQAQQLPLRRLRAGSGKSQAKLQTSATKVMTELALMAARDNPAVKLVAELTRLDQDDFHLPNTKPHEGPHKWVWCGVVRRACGFGWWRLCCDLRRAVLWLAAGLRGTRRGERGTCRPMGLKRAQGGGPQEWQGGGRGAGRRRFEGLVRSVILILLHTSRHGHLCSQQVITAAA